jgi:hypothetical protein
MLRLMPDGVSPNRSAAAVNEPASATATNTLKVSLDNIVDFKSKDIAIYRYFYQHCKHR